MTCVLKLSVRFFSAFVAIKILSDKNYGHPQDVQKTNGDIQKMGHLILLPPTFTSDPQYMHERTEGAMTYFKPF